MISRRSLLAQLALLGVGAAAILLYRERVMFPPPGVTFTGPGDATGWMTFPASGGLIRLPGGLAGKLVQVVVDSGAEFSAVDRGLAERLGLAKGLPLPILAFGVTGQPTVTRTVSFDLDLGPLRLTNLHAATLDLAPLSRATGQPFSLLIGRDVLKSLVMDIDFADDRVAFTRPDAYTPPPGAVAVPVTRSRGALLTPVTVEGRAPMNALVDTGMTGALALSASAAEAIGLLEPGRTITGSKSVGLGGVSIDRVVIAREVAFAGVVVRNVPVQIFEAALGPVPSALIGTGLLERFRTVVDLSRGRLHLTPPAPRRRNRS